jgi:hypothetical protein
MEQIFKLFLIDEKPYLTVDEDVKVGDKVIVTVGGQYPSLIECKNDDQINLIQKPQTSLTKRHKVVMQPKEMELDEKVLSILRRTERAVSVFYENGEINILEEE